MFVISALLNSSVPEVSDIVRARDEKKLLELAQGQVEFGADALDVNCGSHHESEAEDISWMVKTLGREIRVPLCIDSPDPKAQAAALARVRHGRPIVDSTTLEPERIRAMMPLVKEYDAQLIVLLHDESGMPKSSRDRLAMMPKVEQLVSDYGMKRRDILLDPLLYPLSTGDEQPSIYFETLKRLRSEYPDYLVSCGLDNVSSGMPARTLLDIAMVTMCAACGQNAVMIKLNPQVAAFLKAIRALRGEDEFCMDYLDAYRKGILIYNG